MSAVVKSLGRSGSRVLQLGERQRGASVAQFRSVDDMIAVLQSFAGIDPPHTQRQ
jgi:hypothetical protein